MEFYNNKQYQEDAVCTIIHPLICPFTAKTNLIKISNTTADFDKAAFSSSSSILYILTSSPQLSVVSRMSDFSNFVLQESCQVSTVSAITQPSSNGGGSFEDFTPYYANDPDFISTLASVTDIQKLITQPSGFRILVNTTFGAVPHHRVLSGDCNPAAPPVIPFIPDRTGPRISNSSGGFIVGTNQTVSISQITQCSGMLMIYTFVSTPAAGSWCFSYNSNSFQIVLTPTNNSCGGSFNLYDIEKNSPPTVVQNFTTSVLMYAHHNYTWDVYIDQDKENDSPVANVTVLDTSNNPVAFPYQWFFFNNVGAKQIQVKAVNAPQPAGIAVQVQYKIKLEVTDAFNIPQPNIYYIDLKIKRNYPPYRVGTIDFTIPDIIVPQSFSKTFWYSDFFDFEKDPLTIICSSYTSTGQDANWITAEFNKTVDGNVTIFGKVPPDNSYAGSYQINCDVKDLNTDFESIQFSLNVVEKQTFQIATPQQNIQVAIPQTSEIVFNAVDAYGQQMISTLYINSAQFVSGHPLFNSGWISWDASIPKLILSPYDNSQGGSYAFSVKFDDPDHILSQTSNDFSIFIQQNQPVISIATIQDQFAISNNRFQIDIDTSSLFQDPESLPITTFYRFAGGGSLPYFVSQFPNGTLSGFTTDEDVGSYQFECVGQDNGASQAFVSFIFQVKDSCYQGSYGNTTENACIKCPKGCKTCFGSDYKTQCNECETGYFKLGYGCYFKCPDGYYGDKADKTCKQCNKACASCTGPSYTQCNRCNDLIELNEFNVLARKGFLLTADSECVVPQCKLRQFFFWDPLPVNDLYTGLCTQCYETCLTCVGEAINECILCLPGHVYDEKLHTCTKCEDFPGLFTNEEYQCEDICGDGLVIDKQCDDGNTFSGDGCNSACEVEYGYECNSSGCRETIPPILKVDYITKTNLLYISFSKYVYIQNETSLQKSNMNLHLDYEGKSYLFDYRTIEDPNQKLIPNRSISKFMIKLQDFQQTISGEEDLTVALKDYGQIKDSSGNKLRNLEQMVHPAPFIFLSDTEKMIVNGLGQTIRYGFMSTCSFNVALKMLLNSTMQFLWGLVHSLQIFAILLYINIDFPENVLIFSNFMQVASGDLSDFGSVIPDMKKEKMIILFITNSKMMRYLRILLSPMAKNQLCGLLVCQFQFLKIRTASMVLASGIALITGAIAMLMPFLVMSLIYHHRKSVNKEKWNNQFGMLTYEVKNNRLLQAYYYPIFLYQRLVIVTVIVYGTPYPLVQCLIIMICNFGMIAYLLSQKPFKEEISQTTIALDELAVNICVAFFILIQVKDMKGDNLKNVGYIILVFIVISVFKNLVIVIVFGIQSAQHKIKQMFQAEDQQQDSQDSSDYDQEQTQISDEEQNKINTKDIYEEIQREIYEQNNFTSYASPEKINSLKVKNTNDNSNASTPQN
ncbi:cadg multi-domain protein [Stylonychia lemnae]|uniref:Cadg multi-domain protein n=1 Tax=Stylonychia lemnae TaxID=5949 RepID=A0A078B8W7_STYLE|nr:cadg multi-domain protein [Stylonychia lemnae]|eukprot:CDW90935.1 cadg multi-domain protein [Stylonychia lemnae]